MVCRSLPSFLRFGSFQLPLGTDGFQQEDHTYGQRISRVFRSGNPRKEPGAVVCRASPSFVRFGSFQLPSTRPDDLPLVQQLADYVIQHHYPHLEGRAWHVVAVSARSC